MSDKPDFDPAVVHRYFSATCFNKTWEFIDNPKRTPEEDMTMLQASMASLWHWSQRRHRICRLEIGWFRESMRC
jgi:hypothetical protein